MAPYGNIPLEQTKRWIEVRAQLVQVAKFSGHLLPREDVAWARDLYIMEDMFYHPYGPGKEQCDWYIEQIELFLGYADGVIESQMKEWMPYADRVKRRQLIESQHNTTKAA